jgi:hypothetical protein
MSACNWQSFSGISPEVWDRIKVELANSHVIAGPVPDRGTQASNGYTVTWRYDLLKQTLDVQMLDSPWYAACSSITSAIADEVAKAKLG